MTAPIDLWIPGSPVAQPRPRGRLAGPRHKPFVHIYNPPDADDWKMAVALYAQTAFKFQPIDQALQVRLAFTMPRPDSHYRTTVKEGRRLRADAPVWHTNKPDGDNLEKAVLDALTGIVWTDDCRICQTYREKKYGEEPGVRIVIARAEPEFIEADGLFQREAACS